MLLLCVACAPCASLLGATAASQPQPAQTLTYTVPEEVAAHGLDGVVVDSDGLGIVGASIQEYSWDWQVLLAETHTDHQGRFLLVPGAPVHTHYLRISALGFDILQVRVQVSADTQQKTGKLRLRLRGSS